MNEIKWAERIFVLTLFQHLLNNTILILLRDVKPQCLTTNAILVIIFKHDYDGCISYQQPKKVFDYSRLTYPCVIHFALYVLFICK